MIAIILITAHLIGDFMLQNARLAKHKQSSFTALIKHSIIYAICMLVVFAILPPLKAIIPFIILTAVHFGIDFARTKANHLTKRNAARRLWGIFLLDQALHVGVIFAVCWVFRFNENAGSLLKLSIDTWSPDVMTKVLAYIMVYVLALNPTAVLVKKTLCIADANSDKELKNDDDKANRNGYMIGILERLIIVTLVLSGNLPTVGFVLAAKSIARFKQLENKDFAEKYLVGTLLSMGIAILSALIVRQYISVL